MSKTHRIIGQEGMVTPLILVILAIFFVFATSVMNWAFQARKDVLSRSRGTQALQVAEAGVDYYKWHLAHSDSDYKDGNEWCCVAGETTLSSAEECGGKCGPYTHIYKDYDGNEIGQYMITITPPAVGSTIVGIESEGKIFSDSRTEKTIRARLGKLSLARYSFLSDAPIWIGENEGTSGPVHSNGGIRFDGTCDAEVTSYVDSYDCDTVGHDCTGIQDGIWGSADPDCSQYWKYPEDLIDFELFTLDMAKLKAAAQEDGLYLAPSGVEGYWLVFRADDKVDVYKVSSLTEKVKYYNDDGVEVWDYERIQSTGPVATYALPDNGVIFVEDDTWVEGTVSGRVTVAASRFADQASNYARIIIQNDIQYVTEDGSDVLGLMAEGDILVPKHAPTVMNIDAVMLSQKGHVYARDYKSNGVKDTITVYGGVITNEFWTWTWVSYDNDTVSGFKNTNTIYDNHLTFSPPPMFPTEDEYTVLDWAEE